MSDVMRPIPFAQVMDWVLREHETQGSIFGVRKAYVHKGGAEKIFEERIETPFGPAAGLALDVGHGPQQLPLPASVHLDVPVIGQNPELPNGCEITSLTMLLQYLGFDVDKMTMAEDYLPRSEKFYGADPEVEFMGNPSQSSGESCGFYCFQGPIIQAAEKYLAAQGQADAWEVTDITGVDAAGLAEQLAAGNPVLVWATIDFKDVRESSKWSWTTASGETYTPLVDVHCLVLTGYEDNQFYLSDPLETYESVRQQKFMEIFTAMGSRAVVITPKEPAPEPTPDPSAEASSVPSSAA